MNIDRKKYLILMLPALIIATTLFIYLPTDKKGFSTFVILAAWVIYYSWLYIKKRETTK
ncbi:hypothetical protein [Bacillus sp. PS06]|uniref:hypothetical protein n=1 Tax=Bacillus sp. PS06 TaxID=2764176 RepID=UPI00177E5759|nr:hypothetical protein [Bacillus sp. PS06]MBD8068825.1 hypothetical protein [Bacillus sp. PS06]